MKKYKDVGMCHSHTVLNTRYNIFVGKNHNNEIWVFYI